MVHFKMIAVISKFNTNVLIVFINLALIDSYLANLYKNTEYAIILFVRKKNFLKKPKRNLYLKVYETRRFTDASEYLVNLRSTVQYLLQHSYF